MAFLVFIVFFSVTLTTSAPLQGSTILKSSSDFSSSSTFQYVYASSDGDGGGGDGGGDDGGGGDGGGDDGGGDDGGGDDGGGDDGGGDESSDEGGDESGDDEGGDESSDEGGYESNEDGIEENSDSNDESESSDSTEVSETSESTDTDSTEDSSSFFGGTSTEDTTTDDGTKEDTSSFVDESNSQSTPRTTEDTSTEDTTGASLVEGTSTPSEQTDGTGTTEAASTIGSTSTEDADDAMSFFGGGGKGSDEGTPESASADASESTEGTTGTSPTDTTFYNRYATSGTSPTEGTTGTSPTEGTTGTSPTEGTTGTSPTEGTTKQGIIGTPTDSGDAPEKATLLLPYFETDPNTPADTDGPITLDDVLKGGKITTPAGTTGGGIPLDDLTVIVGGKEGSLKGKFKFPNAEEKGKFESALAEVGNLEGKLKKAKDIAANNPDEVVRDTYKNDAIAIQSQLDLAKKKLDDIAKGATPTTGTEPSPIILPRGDEKKPPKKDNNDNNDRNVVKIIKKTKVIYRDNDDNTDKEIVVIGNKNTCPTQTETVALNGKINPKGIRLLADFDPCRISDGSVTLNMPNTGSIKLALLFIDKAGNNDAGVLIKPVKIQDLSTNQALFTIELDGNMNGINPITGKSTSISRINGLALYNDGNQPIQLNSGNMAALTATFTK